MAWSGSVQLRDMPRYYRLRTVLPRRPRNGLADRCPCRSQARTIPFIETVFTTILRTLFMAYEEDTSKQQSGQEKPVVRRDKVVVTKVTEQELAQIKSTADQCGMTRSDFIRARALGYKPRQRLSDKDLDGLRQLAACRTDMVNFANALHGLTDNEKIRLSASSLSCLTGTRKWHLSQTVSPTSCSPRRRPTIIRQEQQMKMQRRTTHDSQSKSRSPRHKGDAVCVG